MSDTPRTDRAYGILPATLSNEETTYECSSRLELELSSCQRQLRAAQERVVDHEQKLQDALDAQAIRWEKQLSRYTEAEKELPVEPMHMGEITAEGALYLWALHTYATAQAARVKELEEQLRAVLVGSLEQTQKAEAERDAAMKDVRRLRLALHNSNCSDPKCELKIKLETAIDATQGGKEKV